MTPETEKRGEHTPLPWFVRKCPYCEDGYACAISPRRESEYHSDGSVFHDWSSDECHHPIKEEDAALIVRAVNAHDALLSITKRLHVALSEESPAGGINETAIGKLLEEAQEVISKADPSPSPSRERGGG